jgi:hypothetical protein
MRTQIWGALCNLQFKSYCLTLLVKKNQHWDRNINVFLAIASSTSIAAWAIWKVTPIIWASIIAVSQVLTVVKPYFPYFKYVKEFNLKCVRLELMNIEYERLWHRLQNKKVTDDEADEQYFELRKQTSEILNFSDDTIFEVTPLIEKKANEMMKNYLQTNYGISININNK